MSQLYGGVLGVSFALSATRGKPRGLAALLLLLLLLLAVRLLLLHCEFHGARWRGAIPCQRRMSPCRLCVWSLWRAPVPAQPGDSRAGTEYRQRPGSGQLAGSVRSCLALATQPPPPTLPPNRLCTATGGCVGPAPDTAYRLGTPASRLRTIAGQLRTTG